MIYKGEGSTTITVIRGGSGQWILEVNRDRGLAPGETETKCLYRLKPGVPIHLHCPDPSRLTLV